MVVFDASTVGPLLFPEPHTPNAYALLRNVTVRHMRIMAPYLISVEVTNIVRKRMRRDRLTLTEATQRLNNFLALPIESVEPVGLHHRALALTEAYSLGAHDAHYVALAEMYGCDLWVDDERMLRAIGGRLPFVKSIAGYPLSAPDDR